MAEQAEHTLDEQEGYFDQTSSSGCDESTTATTLSVTLSATQYEPSTEEENIQFLLTCFPTLALDDLKQALTEQENDLERATDILLNRDLIQQDNDDYFNLSKLKQREDQNDQEFFTKMEQQKKKNKKSKKVQQQKTPMGSELDDKEDDEKRVALAVTKMSHYFPQINQKMMQQVAKQYNGAILPSVKRIMEKEPTAEPESHFRDWDSIKALMQVKTSLETVMVEQTDDAIYRVAVAAVIQEEQRSVEHMTQVAIDFFLSKAKPEWTFLEPQRKPLVIKQPEPKTKSELPAIPDYLHLDNQQDYMDDDPIYCREKASDLMEERNELYRKAAASFRRSKNKGPGETGIAYFYSDSARKLDEQAKTWNMRAAKATIRQER